MPYLRTALLLLPVCAAAASAESAVRGWRGDGTGRYPDATPPTAWEDAAQVIWRTPTPQGSNASPVLTGDRLFVCAEPDLLLCLDRNTGALRWQRAHAYPDLVPDAQQTEVRAQMADADTLQRELRTVDQQVRQVRRQAGRNPDDEAHARLAALDAERRRIQGRLDPLEPYRMPLTHTANGYSSATPVTDGAHVYVYFGTGVAAAYDLDGNRRWARLIEKPTDAWGHSASPVLAAGRFIVHVRDVHALDAATGETVWTVRSQPRWGASVVTEIDGHPVVITANGEIIRADDGRLLASGLHRLDYNAPIVHDGVVYFIENGGKAFRLPARADGSEPPRELWRTAPPRERYYASPIWHENRLYAIQQRGLLSVIDAETGAVLQSESIGSLRRTVYPSVTLAGSLLFLGSEGGNAVFLDPGNGLQETATSRIAPFRSTPVFDGSRVYVRTLDAVLCLGPTP